MVLKSPAPGRAGRWVREEHRFLAEASELLATSLEYEVTLSRVARLVIPRLADWSVVDTQEPDGSIRLLAAAHVDPSKEDLIHELRRRYPPDSLAPHGLSQVLRSGQPEVYALVKKAWKLAAARDAEHLGLINALGAESSLCVPLVARGRTLGALTLVYAESRRRYGPTELTLASDLAHRCALALDNALLFKDLQEALRARDALLGSVSHDLKNPLTAIKSYAQLIHTRAPQITDPSIAEQFRTWGAHIDATAQRMAALIDELTGGFSLEAGHPVALDRHPIDLVALAHEVAAEQQQTTDRHQIQLINYLPGLTGCWDRMQLARVLDNLLSNAIKYSPAGGSIIITLSREDGSAGSQAVLSVADRGIGIPAADLPRIFEQSHRASNVGGTVGTGTGLANARQIVEMHHGQIEVKSEEGAGTTITVSLPLEGRVGGRSHFPGSSPRAGTSSPGAGE
jgi:signal transduction histidine kinase